MIPMTLDAADGPTSASVGRLRDRAPRELAIAGESLTVRVRESTRARTTRIIVGPRRPLEVIVPLATPDARIDDLLAEKRAWIERKVAVSREVAARPPLLGLDRPGVVWLAGEELPVERRDGQRSVAWLRDGLLVVSGPEHKAGRAIERWYRREARWRVEAVVAHEAERLQVEYRSVGIRDPRTRWGSCSPNGHLSFSWRLAAAPPEVLEYVVVHEVCHLREPTHRKPFWRLLGAVRPGWEEHSRWLREHGQELHDYAPSRALSSSSKSTE